MCLICDRIKMIKDGTNPYFVKELETGYVVIGDNQHFKGYTLFLHKKHKTELFQLDLETKKKFLGTQYSLCWTESGNGVPKRYDNSKLSSLNLEQLVRHIKTVAKML